MEYKQSDHKPVTSMFTLDTRPVSSTQRTIFVQFHPIVGWRVGDDGVASFNYVNANNEILFMSDVTIETEMDWIGLFKADFTGLDEAIAYNWVSSPYADREDADAVDGALNTQLAIMFGNLLCAGHYCLVYFNGEQNLSVLGISEPFEITC